ncbi:MAG: peptidoglycan DD-metalloendopeptidase family protein [Acidimicrobiia bacterium]|nr:peptidoglycan DD-metalloendopeptidase family protein [Acidimicrobiia bacterium]
MLETLNGYKSPQKSYFQNKKSSISLKAFIINLILISTLLATQTNAFANQSSSPRKIDPLAQAQSVYDKASKEASVASAKYQEANANLAKVNDKVNEVTGQLEQTESSLGFVKDKVATRAINAYIGSSDKADIDEYKEVIKKTRKAQLLDTVAQVDDTQISQFVALKEDLAVQQKELVALQDDAKKTLGILNAQKKELDTKLADAVKARKTIELKIASDKKLAASAALAAAKKSAKSIESSGTIINPGGQKLVCPIAGALAFSNDWGDSRSGGRGHKGIDLFNARGTPNVAMASGRVYFQSGGFGGTAAIVQANNGISYYYAHLSDTVGPPRQVSVGEVIGHTGNSGNAAGGPTHTHFEIWSSSYAKLKPYPTISSLC